MAKRSKIQTPDWVLKGDTESKSKKKKSKTFKVRRCPKCGSDDVGLVLSNSSSEESVGNTGKEWTCRKCGWKGESVKIEELSEDEFMKYLDEKGEEVA